MIFVDMQWNTGKLDPYGNEILTFNEHKSAIGNPPRASPPMLAHKGYTTNFIFSQKLLTATHMTTNLKLS